MKIALIGSLPPYKDGIADHNHILFENLVALKKNTFNIYSSDNENADYPEKLKKYIKNDLSTIKNKYDLVHMQFGNSYPNSFVFKTFNIVKNSDVKIISTLHDFTNTNFAKILRTIFSDPKKIIYELNKPSIKEIIERSDKVIVYSKFIRNYLVKKYNQKDKFIISQIGANYSSRSVNKTDNFSIKNSTFKLSSFGSVTPRKGFESVIKAVYSLKKKGLKIQYNIVGSCNFLIYKVYLQSLINIYGLTKEVKLLGFIKTEMVEKIINSSHALVQPRLYTNEGASASLATVLCSRKAIISSNIGAMSEYIDNFNTGLLVSHNPKAYEAAIYTLYCNAPLRKMLGNKSYIWAHKHLDLSKIAKKHLKIYSNI